MRLIGYERLLRKEADFYGASIEDNDPSLSLRKGGAKNIPESNPSRV